MVLHASYTLLHELNIVFIKAVLHNTNYGANIVVKLFGKNGMKSMCVRFSRQTKSRNLLCG